MLKCWNGKKIRNSDISIIVQGPILGKSEGDIEKRLTFQCLTSIRKHLPSAEIILSTWTNSDLRDLDYDILIENDDPGTTNMKLGDLFFSYNVNRQILSTKNGLLRSSRKYAIKMRSDTILQGTSFKKYFYLFNKRCEEYKLLSKRVLTCNISAFSPHKDEKRLFNPSDFFYFGLKSDLLKIWDIPLMKLEQLKDKIGEDVYNQYSNISAEQYIWISLLNKYEKEKISLPYLRYVDDHLSRISEISIVNNLVILSTEQLKIKSLKYSSNMPYIKYAKYCVYYSHDDWRSLYNRYCSGKLINLVKLQKIHKFKIVIKRFIKKFLYSSQ